jgi:anti-sigma regulatory factor (Ser/Thr protein kinase)
VLDEVVLAASELVANAIEHAGTELEVCIEVRDGSTCVAVRDWAPKVWPCPPAGSNLAERGRGLRLVGTLAHRWGWTVSTGSKVVWFQV